MIYFSQSDFNQMKRIERANLINSVSGLKPANLIGSISGRKKTNLAIFSSVIHLGSDPPLLAFNLRPSDEVPRHTLENILENGQYTINHVNNQIAEKAHFTSAKFGREISEFNACQLTEEYITGFEAPFVKESHIKLGMTFVESIPIKMNNTQLIIGRIEHVIVPKNMLGGENNLDLSLSQSVAISGLQTYYSVQKLAQYPYARPNQLPDFH
jgi:flavin reductase (DIM6/NTAB) family NADH-FMN oxidoreductase RutF